LAERYWRRRTSREFTAISAESVRGRYATAAASVLHSLKISSYVRRHSTTKIHVTKTTVGASSCVYWSTAVLPRQWRRVGSSKPNQYAMKSRMMAKARSGVSAIPSAGYSPFRDFVRCRFADAGRRWMWIPVPTAGFCKPSQNTEHVRCRLSVIWLFWWHYTQGRTIYGKRRTSAKSSPREPKRADCRSSVDPRAATLT
jgi:hypothetical protein